MGPRVVGWLLVPTGSLVFALGAFLAWATWDASWAVESLSPTAALAAALGLVTAVAGLVALAGRPRFLGVAVACCGALAVVLAADLFARDAGGWILGELDGWQGSDAAGASSLAPAWALLAEGLALIGAAVWTLRVFGRAAPRGASPAEAPSRTGATSR